MSSNFLNMSGAFAGVDRHIYLALVPPAPAPVVVPFVTHIVSQVHWAGLPMKIATSVTTDGTWVVQSGWQMRLIPHMPIPAGIPHPAEWINLAAMFITSASSPKLAASTVHAQGTPLLVEEYEAFGVNIDCSDSWMGFGADINLNTVKTTPTLSDYAMAVVKIAAQSLIQHVMGKSSEYKANDPFRKHKQGRPRIETIPAAVRAQAKASAKTVPTKLAIQAGLYIGSELVSTLVG